MTDIPLMEETDEPLKDAHKYLVNYTEMVRTRGTKPVDMSQQIYFRDYEVLSLTIQDLLEQVQELKDRIKELEKKN